jgi:SpoVK/Ycf46/Vps4 family AAA+-type ATPase
MSSALFSDLYSWYVYQMTTAKVSNEAELNPAEAILVDVMRMILRGRADEVPARIRKLVTTQAGRRKSRLTEPGRAALALLFAEEAARPAPPRGRSSMQRRTMTSSAPSDAVETTEPVLAAADRFVVDGVVREYHERERLIASGLHPTRTVLLSGPPGVGKSMTMRSIAARVDRPLIRIEPTDVIGSLLGESARSLAAVFAEASEQGAVLGLDEIDALAKRRDDIYDVGEFKRFVTTLLVELDRWPGHAPLIAATNHLDLLDLALERRFEAHIRLGLPDEQARSEILRQVLAGLTLWPASGTIEAIVAVTDGGTGASLTGLVHRAARRAVLDDEPIDRALLMAAIPDGARPDRRARERFAVAARDNAGLTTRAIGELMNCSHTAARRLAQAGAAGT